MDTIPAYKRHRQERRASLLKKFLENLVIPEDFDLDDLEVVEKHLESAPIKTEAFCEWFNLGEWFFDEMVQDEFDIEDFIINLRNRVEEDDREASETYREKQQNYKEMTGMANI